MSKFFSLMFGLIIAFSPCANLVARAIGGPATKVIVGWNFPTAPGVQIFSPPKKNKYYHVLTDTGETLYVAKVLEKLEDDLCLGGKKKHWYLLPDDGPVSLNRASSLVIVIESNVKTQLRAVATKPPDLDQALLSHYVDGIARAGKLTNTAYGIRNAGYQDHTQRVVIILTSKAHAQSDAIDRIVVSVADIDGDNIRERYRYGKSRGDSGDLIANFAAMADIDQDGLADVLLIDQGDFHGKLLLIEKNNQWHKQRDDWGDPC
ncbi:MAG: hypothetical protein KDJ54_19250 [Candidatus Competibacteraceae bacterium]|nr:hypothetical protein [Candidatus Competibacteraceae bacterium]